MKELERKLVNGKVVVTYEEELPRYSVRKRQADYWWDNGEFEDYLINLGVVCYSIVYKWLDNCSYENDSRDKYEVLEDFKKWVYSNHKDYDVYVLQEYRHSGSVFHLTKTADNVDRWDSGVVGFMALPKKVNASHLANEITDVYNGSVDVVEVVDNLTDDVLEQYEFWLHSGSIEEEQKIRKHIKDNFNCEVDENV